MSIRQPRALLLGLSLILTACGGEGLTLPPDGAAAHVVVMTGDAQEGRVGDTLKDPLVVLVTDSQDRPVANANVVFTITDGATAGEAVPGSGTTDANGLTSVALKLGSRAGPVTGVAEVPVPEGTTPVRASFTATSLPANANGIALVSGNEQTGTINTVLAQPLIVQVTDASGNPIAGVAVEWSVAGGGDVSAATTVTGADGRTSVTRTLGPTAGQQTALATATGLAGSPVTFTHVATAGTATGVVKISGDNQSGTPGGQLALPLVVQVLDGAGNPIPNRAVTWAIGAGGGSVAPVNTTTDAQGLASTSWTLGPAVGPNTVNAVVSGLAPATFSATTTAGEPSASNSEVSASPTTVAPGVTSTITVTVRDAANNPVAGASVSIASTGTGNTISPASASTGSNGVATFSFSSSVAESKTITATAGGVAITDQATVTVQKVESTVEITSDDPDPSIENQDVTVEFTVTGTGGTPTGDVVITISNGTAAETCTAALSGGSGSCALPVTQPGTGPINRRVITATYGGDARFAGDTDTENHRVDPLPAANNPPTAAFSPPSCTVGQPCQFNDASTDGDGSIASRAWQFESGTPASSTAENPTVVFATQGPKSVTLTVTDNDGATNSVTHTVTVSAAPPANTAPTAGDDTYLLSGQNITTVEAEPFGLLVNDSDTDGPQPITAVEVSQPAQGSVTVESNGSFTYTPPPLGASGFDSFTYRAFDGELSTTATVNLTFTAIRLK